MVRKKKCVICNRYINKQYEPFCSERCREIDLGKWMTEAYTIPSEESASLPDIEKPESELN